MERLTRRQILQLLGASVVVAHCGPAQENNENGETSSDELENAETPTPRQMLDGIEHFVIVMQENRSFDHFMGALKRDKKYANRSTVSGSSLDDFNWNRDDEVTREKVYIFKADTPKLHSPPHTFPAAHAQWNEGKNDQFVIEAFKKHGEKYDHQPMAYYERSQIPFYYWLADNFTVMDNWHASVMGPTIPNRLYLNTGTSAGHEDNEPFTGDEPETIWDQIRLANLTRKKDGRPEIKAKSYYAGRAGMMAHTLPKKTAAGHIPFAKISEFYDDAKKGTLPHVSYIEPNYHVNDDHPAHDIRLGQAFVSTIYGKLAASPQWSKTLLIVIYDEHGGFWDHVSPPEAHDSNENFRRFGFRVPAFVAGPTVKKGHLASGLHDHTSVLATLALRFGLPNISERAANAETLEHVFDASLFKKNEAAPKPEAISLDANALETVGESSQEELEESIDNGSIPEEYIDRRPLDENIQEWLEEAQSVGAVTLSS
jgi:phospholipase C